MTDVCTCDFDPEYHLDINIMRDVGHDARCRNEPEPNVGLCTPCLFGCAP